MKKKLKSTELFLALGLAVTIGACSTPVPEGGEGGEGGEGETTEEVAPEAEEGGEG